MDVVVVAVNRCELLWNFKRLKLLFVNPFGTRYTLNSNVITNDQSMKHNQFLSKEKTQPLISVFGMVIY